MSETSATCFVLVSGVSCSSTLNTEERCSTGLHVVITQKMKSFNSQQCYFIYRAVPNSCFWVHIRLSSHCTIFSDSNLIVRSQRIRSSNFNCRRGGGGQPNIKTQRNWGIEYVYVGYIKRTSVGSTGCSSSVCLHSVVLVSVHYWLCWMTVRVKESENWRISQLGERTHSWHTFSLTTRMLGYEKRQFLRLCRHTRITGRQHQLRTVGENQNRESSSYTKKDYFEKS
jgi:hypothetical protein